MTARLQLDAAASCASWKELAAGVARRSTRIQLVSSASATPALQASLRPAADGSIAAELVVIHAGGRRSLRRLSAPSCAEAVDALALVIAITLDPTSVSEGGGGAEAAGWASNANGSSNRSGDSEQAGQGAKNGAARAVERADEREAKPSPDELHSSGDIGDGTGNGSAAKFHWQVGAGVAAVFGPAPRWMPGVGLSLLAAWDRASLWSPALRLSATHYWLSGLVETGGTADFSLDSGGLDLCAVRVGSEVLWLRVCANAQAGRLFAQGSHTFSPQSRSRPFAVLGGSSLVTAALSSRLVAGATFSAGRTLIEDEFVLASNVFYRVPALSLGFDLGLALRFP